MVWLRHTEFLTGSLLPVAYTRTPNPDKDRVPVHRVLILIHRQPLNRAAGDCSSLEFRRRVRSSPKGLLPLRCDSPFDQGWFYQITAQPVLGDAEDHQDTQISLLMTQRPLIMSVYV